MSGKTTAVFAGACGVVFIAYCIYFDRKRRSDPRFKEKLRERKCHERASIADVSMVSIHVTGGPKKDAAAKSCVTYPFFRYSNQSQCNSVKDIQSKLIFRLTSD